MLIVEDQDPLRRTLREFLQSAYPDETIVEASSGCSGLALCYAMRPRVMLMDIQLPDANGIELTAQIKSMVPDTEIIIVSSHSASAYRDLARQAGACAFVAKDEVHRRLLPEIHRIFEKTRNEKRIRGAKPAATFS